MPVPASKIVVKKAISEITSRYTAGKISAEEMHKQIAKTLVDMGHSKGKTMKKNPKKRSKKTMTEREFSEYQKLYGPIEPGGQIDVLVMTAKKSRKKARKKTRSISVIGTMARKNPAKRSMYVIHVKGRGYYTGLGSGFTDTAWKGAGYSKTQAKKVGQLLADKYKAQVEAREITGT